MELFDKISGFEWDKGNEQKNAKHGVTNAEAEQVFLNEPFVILDDLKHSETEPRFHALGQTGEGRLLNVTFTIRATRMRVISVI
jgi:uncharacterized protein